MRIMQVIKSPNITLPHDIIFYIGTFLPKNSKINLMVVDKYTFENAHTFLDNDIIINNACKKNDIVKIHQYLQNIAFNPNILIRSICRNNSIDILSNIINNIQHINFDKIYVKNAFANKQYELFTYLGALPMQKNKQFASIFIEACTHGLYNIVKFMLNTMRINNKYNEAYLYAVNHNHYDILELLLSDNRLNPNYSFNQAFRNSVYNNNFNMSKLLLLNDRVDINDMNIINIVYFMNNPMLFNFILSLNKINEIFIKTAIHTCCINKQHINLIPLLINHPKCNINILFNNPNDQFILYKSINEPDILLLLLTLSNIDFVNFYIEYVYNYIKDIKLLFVNNMNNINNDILVYALTKLSVKNQNILISDIVNIACKTYNITINRYNVIMTYLYNDGKYKTCYYYIINNLVDIKYIMDEYRIGNFKLLSPLLSNYY
jgi:hypothetical protein